MITLKLFYLDYIPVVSFIAAGLHAYYAITAPGSMSNNPLTGRVTDLTHAKRALLACIPLIGNIFLVVYDVMDNRRRRVEEEKIRKIKGIAVLKKSRLKGVRNKLNSIPFPDPIKYPTDGRIRLPGIGVLRFHKQDLPEGRIKCGRIVKRASGWYLCLFFDVDAKAIPAKGNEKIGIDPGYTTTLALSTGEKISMPKEFKKRQERLAQAQRGKRKKLTARIHERIKNSRKDNNHKISYRLVAENAFIAFSKDNIKGIARSYGKSVAEASHRQLRQMISYKCIASGRKFVEVDSKFSTKTCSHCLARTGPTGRAGLSVRQWECTGCRTLHDRDTNSANITLIVALGSSVERV